MPRAPRTQAPTADGSFEKPFQLGDDWRTLIFGKPQVNVSACAQEQVNVTAPAPRPRPREAKGKRPAQKHGGVSGNVKTGDDAAQTREGSRSIDTTETAAATAAPTLNVGGFELALDAGSQQQLEPLFSDVWLGTELWPAARALVRYLELERTAALGKTSLVLELGAGTGACGLAAAALGAPHVLLTDVPSLLPTLRGNIAANRHVSATSRVRCAPLSWGAGARRQLGALRGAGADVLVLASDCLNPVYGQTHAAELAYTMHAVLSRGGSAGGCVREAVLAQTRRGEQLAERAFFDACAALGLAVRLLQRVVVDAHTGGVRAQVRGVEEAAGGATLLVPDTGGEASGQLVSLYAITLTPTRGLQHGQHCLSEQHSMRGHDDVSSGRREEPHGGSSGKQEQQHGGSSGKQEPYGGSSGKQEQQHGGSSGKQEQQHGGSSGSNRQEERRRGRSGRRGGRTERSGREAGRIEAAAARERTDAHSL